MQKVNRNDSCPCGSGKKYKACCGLAHSGIQYPDEPEQMIRSRYTAYAIGNVDYIYKTTHPENEALQGKTEEAYKKETLGYCKQVDFIGLTVHETHAENADGITTGKLTARYKVGSKPEDSFTEISEFVRFNGQLVYLRGTEVE